MLRRLSQLSVLLIMLSLLAHADQLGDEKARAKQILKVVIGDIEKNYYDPTFKGVNLRERQTKANEMIDSAKSIGQIYTTIYGLVDSLQDSHTFFVAPGHTVFPKFGFKAKAYGEGVYVYKIKRKGPAETAGLQQGDRIVQVNGFDVDRESFSKMMFYFRALNPVRQMNMYVVRDGKSQPISVTADVHTESIVWDADNDLNYWDAVMESEDDPKERESQYRSAENNDGIGYLWLKTFSILPESAGNFAGLAGKAKGIIIDLRGNHGGAVESLVAFANKFSSASEMLGDAVGRKKTETLQVKPGRGSYSTPMVIIVDSESASAAEIFARHFQRIKKATVIGDQSSGHVVVAQFFNEKLGTDRFVPFGMEISVARFVVPGNETLEGKGVTPDQKCLPSAADLKAEKDVCYALAVDILKKQLNMQNSEDKGNPGKTGN
jgi:C-terminal processing protease CtpA/Prc